MPLFKRSADGAPPAVRQEVVEGLGQLLESIHVIPEAAARLQQLTRGRLAVGAYDHLDREAFASRPTQDLQDLSGDRHLRVMFGEQMTPMMAGAPRVVTCAPGGRGGRPSQFTASGGEEFTYGLKHHGRATVVGSSPSFPTSGRFTPRRAADGKASG